MGFFRPVAVSKGAPCKAIVCKRIKEDSPSGLWAGLRWHWGPAGGTRLEAGCLHAVRRGPPPGMWSGFSTCILSHLRNHTQHVKNGSNKNITSKRWSRTGWLGIELHAPVLDRPCQIMISTDRRYERTSTLLSSVHVTPEQAVTRHPPGRDRGGPLTGKKSGTWKRWPFVCGRASKSSV